MNKEQAVSFLRDPPVFWSRPGFCYDPSLMEDYSLCDAVLRSLFIPRIKRNVPLDWCSTDPTEVCVYENGPRDAAEIRACLGRAFITE